MTLNFKVPNLYTENIYNVFKTGNQKGILFTTDTSGRIISFPPPSTNNLTLRYNSSATFGVNWSSAFPSTLGLGTILVYNSLGDVIPLSPPSTDGLVLGYDSSATFGVHWITAGSSTTTFPPTAGPGTIFVYNSSGNVVALPPGLPGQFLSMSSITLGELEWVDPPNPSGSGAIDVITDTAITTTSITIADLITLDITTITLGSYNYFYVDGRAVMKSFTGPLRGAAYTQRTLFKRDGSVVEENPGDGCDDRLVFEGELDTNYQEKQGFDAYFESDSTFIYFRVQQPTSATMNFSWRGVLEYTAI